MSSGRARACAGLIAALLSLLTACARNFGAASHARFPEVKDWNSLRMGLKRSMCYGTCPAYSVEVHGNGEVDFNGESHVLITGRHRDWIPKQLVRDLVTYFEGADYFSLKDEYVATVTDNPSYVTWIEFDRHKKSVTDYVGL